MSRIIKDLSSHEVDEIDGVYEYAKTAVCLLEDGRDSDARIFYDMAVNEKEHAEKIHEILEDEVKKMERRSAERGMSIPNLMKQHYEDKHARYVEKYNLALEYIEVYKSMTGMR